MKETPRCHENDNCQAFVVPTRPVRHLQRALESISGRMANNPTTRKPNFMPNQTEDPNTAATPGAQADNPPTARAQSADDNRPNNLPKRFLMLGLMRKRAAKLGLRVEKSTVNGTYTIVDRQTKQLICPDPETGRGVPFERVVEFLDDHARQPNPHERTEANT